MTDEQDTQGPGADDAEAAATVEDGQGTYDKEEEEVSDGMVQDLITGATVKLNDKEAIRQEEERKLLEELGYEHADYKDLIRLNLSIKPSQGKAKRFPLVVLHQPKPGEALPPAKRAFILYDIQPKKKAEDSKAGAEALADLLTDIPSAEYAVWTNGTDQVVWFKQRTALKIRTLYANDIPRYGKGIEDTFEPGRRKLRKAVSGSLRQAFRRCHDYIFAIRGGSNESVFWELLKIVFAKIEDERQMAAAAPGSEEADGFFRIISLEERNDPEKAKDIAERVNRLYEQVRSRYPELFRQQAEEIDLDPRIVTYLVSQISHYDFLGSSVDVKGEAYEAIVGKNLQGTRGEFFTPRNAVKMAVKMLDPKPGMKCIDPACGTGGFIVVILGYIAEQVRRAVAAEGLDGADFEREFRHRMRLVSQDIYGLDINPNLVRVARMNMVMNNDGQGGVTHLNGLEPDPQRWNLPDGELKRYQEDGTEKTYKIRDFFTEALEEGTFDIVATNPPFGTKIKIDDENLLTEYTGLGFRWGYDEERGFWSQASKLQAKVPPEILFIERVVRLLKPGTGRACIVLPNGILGNPDDEYIRQWLLKECQILALVAMPVELFLPKVGIQTHLIFLRRKSTDEMNREARARKPTDYDIFMAIAKKVGKDRRDNPLYKRDPDGTELTHFRDFNGRDLHAEWKAAGVYDFVPEVDEYGRMRDDDLPFIAAEYHKFVAERGGHVE
jgi:type I restriction enzyme M protein